MKKKILVSALLLTIGFTATTWANDHSPMNTQPIPCVRTHQPSFIRNMLSNELPAALRASIKKDYKDYWISELYEAGDNTQSSYFITVENADQIVKLTSSDSATWTVVSTTLKDI